MTGRVVVVTDSTAVIAAQAATAVGVRVLPLPVLIGDQTYDDGAPGATPSDVVAALEARVDVSTSRLAPGGLIEFYRELAAEGVTNVVAVHLSAELSGTVDSSRIAADRSTEAGIDIITVDSRMVGPVLGMAVIAAAEAALAGASANEVAEIARSRVSAGTSYFYVDSLDYLRRGGRIGAAAALVGTALAVKPILTIGDGQVLVKEKVRTANRALARLEELTVEASEGPIELVVAHMGAPERAVELAQRLTARLAGRLSSPVRVEELGAVLGAHVGPGLVATCQVPAVTAG